MLSGSSPCWLHVDPSIRVTAAGRRGGEEEEEEEVGQPGKTGRTRHMLTRMLDACHWHDR